MKSIFESGEVMAAYAGIDLCYYSLRKMYEEMAKPVNPINEMIDNATGFGKATVYQNKATAKTLLERIIENKKFIEADTTLDEQALEALKQL